MELFEKITNLYGNNLEESIKKAIVKTKNDCDGLTEERMCKVYNSVLLQNLMELHLSCRLINSQDLGLTYEHVFVLVSSKTIMGGGYYLADLTFSQFPKATIFKDLLFNGYQKINDLDFSTYLNILNGQPFLLQYTLEEVYFSLEKDRKR